MWMFASGKRIPDTKGHLGNTHFNVDLCVSQKNRKHHTKNHLENVYFNVDAHVSQNNRTHQIPLAKCIF